MTGISNIDAAVTLATQLRANADAHHDQEGTERRRAADLLDALVQELNALYPHWSAMTTERSEWQIRALEAEAKLGRVQS